MEPALTTTLLVLLFGVLHIGLATRRVRGALVARLGEGGFTALFSVLASISFAVLVMYYAAHRFSGAPGLALGSEPVLRWMLMGVAVAGVALMVAGGLVYPGSPYDMFKTPIRGPRGLERITRHPFFVGVALFGIAHALLATRLVSAVVFAGLALIAILGAWHQDAKLLARRGRPFAEYLTATSAVPLAVGTWSDIWRELPWGALIAGVVVAYVLRSVHDSIFAHGGAWVILTVVGGAGVLTWQSWRRARRVGAPHVRPERSAHAPRVA